MLLHDSPPRTHACALPDAHTCARRHVRTQAQGVVSMAWAWLCCCWRRLLFCSSTHASIFALSSVAGCSMSTVSSALLKGSRCSLSRCRWIVALSRVCPEVGSMTGSFISVHWIGSRKSSGMSPKVSSSSWSSAAAPRTFSANASKARTLDSACRPRLRSTSAAATNTWSR